MHPRRRPATVDEPRGISVPTVEARSMRRRRRLDMNRLGIEAAVRRATKFGRNGDSRMTDKTKTPVRRSSRAPTMSAACPGAVAINRPGRPFVGDRAVCRSRYDAGLSYDFFSFSVPLRLPCSTPVFLPCSAPFFCAFVSAVVLVYFFAATVSPFLAGVAGCAGGAGVAELACCAIVTAGSESPSANAKARARVVVATALVHHR